MTTCSLAGESTCQIRIDTRTWLCAADRSNVLLMPAAAADVQFEGSIELESTQMFAGHSPARPQLVACVAEGKRPAGETKCDAQSLQEPVFKKRRVVMATTRPAVTANCVPNGPGKSQSMCLECSPTVSYQTPTVARTEVRSVALRNQPTSLNRSHQRLKQPNP